MSVQSEVALGSITVAAIEANCSGVRRSGAIVREARYVVSIDGVAVGQAGTFESAAHRLATAIRNGLPRGGDGNWGVVVRCPLRPDVGLAFGNAAVGVGGGGGFRNQCVARIAAEYNHGDNNLERALEFAARLIQACCVS